MRRALGVLVAWLVLSVLLAPLAGKALRARREQMEHQAHLARLAHRGVVVHPVLSGPRVIRDRPVPRAYRAR